MKKLIIALVVVAPMLILSGCVTETVYYTPGYRSTYATSVGYYNSPYWSNADYYGYDDLSNVGYWGMYDSYSVY